MNTQAPAIPLENALAAARTQTGDNLLDLSRRSPVMLVFLRHTGCPFCREAMADIKTQREQIERSLSRAMRIVFVHQAPEDEANAAFFDAAGVGDIPRVSDPARDLYRLLEIPRGSLWAVFGPYVWFRVLQTMLTGRKIGRMIGDVFQMPGIVIIEGGRIVARHQHKTQADRPNYTAIACSLPPN